MGTQVIHHQTNILSRFELWIKSKLPRVAKENQRFVISAFAFSVSVIFTSIAVSVASFADNDFILALVLILSLVTLALCISVSSLKLILATGVVSFITSITSIIYLLIKHWDLYESFLKF